MPPRAKIKCKACGGSGVSSSKAMCAPCKGTGVKQLPNLVRKQRGPRR